MSDTSYLQWPFFEARHSELASTLDAWATDTLSHHPGSDVDAECRMLVRTLGQAGWLRHAVGGTAYGGAREAIDTRVICLIRETRARHHGLADFAFAMQGARAPSAWPALRPKSRLTCHAWPRGRLLPPSP